MAATRGDGEVTLSWATYTGTTGLDYEYRQRREPGSYGRWTDFAGDEFKNDDVSNDVTSNIVSSLTNGGTYVFQVRAVVVARERHQVSE